MVLKSTGNANPGSPSQAADFDSLIPLLQPRSVAIIGASSDPTRIGGRPVASMIRGKYQGLLMPVNPKRDEIQGIKAYASIDDLPEAPDTAIVALPAAAVVDTIEALGRRGGRSAIVFSSGFREIGGEGERLQEQLVETARRWNMRILGPNTIGVVNNNIAFYGSFTSSLERGFPLPGRIGIASQSGAYAGHLMGLARTRNMGTPISVATGNESDVTLGETIGWMVRNPDIDVVMAYAEMIRHVDSFVAALEEAHAARKPVILQKVGRSTLGRKAALSHTASLAGDDNAFDAMLADYAVIRVESSAELLNMAYAATRRIYPVNNTLGVLTVSGGAGIMTCDVAEELNLPLPPMPAEAQAKLKEKVYFSSPVNPLDCTAHVLNDLSLVGEFGESMAVEGGYKSLMAFFTVAGTAPSVAPQLCAELKKVKDAHPDRLFVVSVTGDMQQAQIYEDAGFILMEDLVEAVRVVDGMGKLGDAFARPLPRHAADLEPITLPGKALSEAEAKRLLAEHGIASVREEIVTDADAAVAAAQRLGFPVVMKIVSPDITHKSDIGGVLVGIEDAEAARASYATLIANVGKNAPQAHVEGVLVAQQISGVECFMGVQNDPQYGPVAAFGLGGIFVEVLKDVTFRRCPFDIDAARQMILSIKGAPLLQGARGQQPVDIEALSAMLSALSEFAARSAGTLGSIDLNPVFALPAGQGAFAADAVIQPKD